MTTSGDSATETGQAVQTVPENPDPDLAPKAIAVRVGDRDLWIGNVGAIKPRLLAKMDIEPEFVVSVNGTATAVTTDHYPLKDERINNPKKFSNAVSATRDRIRTEGTVLVNCSVGVSRSATVIATAIAAEEELSFDAAVAEVRKHRQRAQPHPKLQLNAYAYLLAEENRIAARQQLTDLVDSLHIQSQSGKAIEALLLSD